MIKNNYKINNIIYLPGDPKGPCAPVKPTQNYNIILFQF